MQYVAAVQKTDTTKKVNDDHNYFGQHLFYCESVHVQLIFPFKYTHVLAQIIVLQLILFLDHLHFYEMIIRTKLCEVNGSQQTVSRLQLQNEQVKLNNYNFSNNMQAEVIWSFLMSIVEKYLHLFLKLAGQRSHLIANKLVNFTN